MDAPAAVPPLPLRAYLLGSTRLQVGDRTIPDRAWSRRAARSLLLLLLLAPDHRLPRDRVLDLLWPGLTPDSADQALRKAVHLLRRVLEPDLRNGRGSAFIDVSVDVIGLRSGVDLWVDVEAFETALASARSASLPDRRTLLRQALAHYGNDLLGEEPYAEWADAPRERLRQQRRRAALDLADHDLLTGEPDAILPVLEQILEADNTDEEVLRALMRALAASDRRDDALRWYHRTSAALRTDLDAEPDDQTRDLFHEIHALVSPPAPPLPQTIAIRPHAGIPASPNLLVGRSREVEQVQDLLSTRDVRLVTVTGTGGVGKSRVAQEAARLVADDFADGVCFVALATIRDPSLVLPVIGQALGLAGDGRHAIDEILQAALRGRDLLLVLDNVEQVIEAAPQVASLLERCDRLTVLATSREPLRLRAEQEVLLTGLSAPSTVNPGRSHLLVRYAAVELFLRRAHAVRPSFVLTDENARLVVDLCRKLDGLPLAIELAAAQAREHSPEELLAGLTDRFALLAGGYRDLPARQQSLHAAIGWSYDLLSMPRRKVFRLLAVFAGDFTADAAGEVLSRAGDAVAASIDAGIDALVGSNQLVRREDDDEPRFSMLESIREYGLRELSANGEEAATRHGHATWFLTLAEEAAPILAESYDGAWLDRLEADLANFRSALTWALGQPDAEIALRLASALRRFWLARGYLVEGRDWIERALARGAPEPSQMRARATFAAGELSFFLEDLPRAKSLAEEGLAICRALGDARGAADALLGLGHIARRTGDLDQAATYLTEGLTLARSEGDEVMHSLLQEAMATLLAELGRLDDAESLYEEQRQREQRAGNERSVASSLSGLASVARKRGDMARAVALLEEAVAIATRGHDAYATVVLQIELGAFVVDLGDHSRAADLLRESIALAWDHRFDALAADGLRVLTSLAIAQGEPERAARLASATVAFCQAVGTAMPFTHDDPTGTGENAPSWALGDALLAEALATDPALSPEQALAAALSDSPA